MYNQKRVNDLLKQMSFVRFGGTKEELKAAKLIQSKLKEIKIPSVLESFSVQTSTIKTAKLEVLAPKKITIPCTAYLCCANTTQKGLEADFYYFEQAHDVNLKEAKGKICLVNGYVGKKVYKEFIKAGAVGLISFNGNIDFPDEYDLDQREMRKGLAQLGNMPAVNILVKDALKLIDNDTKRVRITTLQQPSTAQSHNVVCEIKGLEGNDTIALTAHYDSVHFSKGAYDNATGSVCLLVLVEHFSKHQPRHNLKFIWCGSEERGLLGSVAYVEKHKKILEQIKLCINVDMIGSILGKRIAESTADMSLVNYIDYLGKEIGFPINSSQGVYSSDSTPFADVGIPAVSFARITPHGGGDIHHRYDVLEHLSERFLKEDIEFILEFTSRMANAYVIPVPRVIPQTMLDEIDKYYCREKDTKKIKLL